MSKVSDRTLLQAQLTATAIMTGIIWTVQCVVYPQYFHVAPENFLAYHDYHKWAISPIVVPVMLVEAGLALILFCRYRKAMDLRPWMIVNLATVGLLWLSTATLQAPMHLKLEQGWDDTTIRQLIVSNWVRTAIWSARILVVMDLWRRVRRQNDASETLLKRCT